MSLLEQIQQKKAVAAEAVKAKAEAEAAEKKEKIEGKKSERAELVTACDRLGEEINGMMSELGEAENIPIDELSAEDKKDIADMISASKLELKNKQGELKNLELKIANLDQDLSSLGAGEQVIQKEEQEKYSVGETVPAPPSAMSQGLEERSLGSVDQKEEEGQKEKEEGVVSFKELPVMSVEEFNSFLKPYLAKMKNSFDVITEKDKSEISPGHLEFLKVQKQLFDGDDQMANLMILDQVFKSQPQLLSQMPKEILEKLKKRWGFTSSHSRPELPEYSSNKLKEEKDQISKNLRRLELVGNAKDPEVVKLEFSRYLKGEDSNLVEICNATMSFGVEDMRENIVNILRVGIEDLIKKGESVIAVDKIKPLLPLVERSDPKLAQQCHAFIIKTNFGAAERVASHLAVDLEKLSQQTGNRSLGEMVKDKNLMLISTENFISARHLGLPLQNREALSFGVLSIMNNNIVSDDFGIQLVNLIKLYEYADSFPQTLARDQGFNPNASGKEQIISDVGHGKDRERILISPHSKRFTDEKILEIIYSSERQKIRETNPNLSSEDIVKILSDNRESYLKTFRQNLAAIKSRYSVD